MPKRKEGKSKSKKPTKWLDPTNVVHGQPKVIKSTINKVETTSPEVTKINMDLEVHGPVPLVPLHEDLETFYPLELVSDEIENSVNPIPPDKKHWYDFLKGIW